MKINLAGAILDDNVTILTNSSGLLGESLRRAGVGFRLEVMLLVRHPYRRF